jgi:restriction system protein
MSLKSFVKGWLGELQGTLAKKLFLDSSEYVDVNSVTLPIENGTTQIDHIIVSRYGVFVVETKNMDGWIFGDEKSPNWTQSLYGKKFQFQNPLHQNYRHTRTLSEFLGIEHEKVFSVVMFWGEVEFRTTMPPNVLSSGYASYIKSKSSVIFSDTEVQDMVVAIQNGMAPIGLVTRREHVIALKERFASTTTCPKCGSPLVLRTAKSGKNTGHKFYGCSSYPKCRHITPVSAKT